MITRKQRPLLVGLFVVTLGIGDRAIAFVAGRIVGYSQNQFAMMYEGRHRADILFMGDSRVDRNFNFKRITELTGRTTLNLGLGGNSVLVSEALLKDYVGLYGPPKLVIIELSQTLTNPDSLGEMRIFSARSRNMRALAKALDPTFAAFGSLFKSLTYNDPAFWRMATEVFKRPESRMLTKTISRERIKRWENPRRFNRPIYEENMRALQRICSFADSLGLRLVLLVTPCWERYFGAIMNYPDWMRRLKMAVGERPIFDYATAFIAQPEYFNDEIHLNKEGATRFVEILNEDGIWFY